jgi:hypothetical protein
LHNIANECNRKISVSKTKTKKKKKKHAYTVRELTCAILFCINKILEQSRESDYLGCSIGYERNDYVNTELNLGFMQSGSSSCNNKWVQGTFSLGVKRPGREADHSPSSNAEVKDCVEVYLHSPNTPSWRDPQLKHTISSPYLTKL